MVAKLTILYMNEHLDVELEPDGGFDITNRDMEQEQLMAFMTGQESAAVIVWNSLQANLLESVITFAFDYNVVQEEFKTGFVIGFMIDCLEHVADVNPEMREKILRFTKVAHRLNDRFEYGNQAREPLDAVSLSGISSAVSVPLSKLVKSKILQNIQVAYRQIYLSIIADYIRDITLMERLQVTISNTANARAHSLIELDGGKKAWETGLDLEHAWQARRLIHLIEAKQQKDQRPTIEETP